ncbi:6173_t:CDS:2 [Dentiscutata heterogama]|uniref:6173_t:CDS:1 n=1 Tax=Dentiscutata heterogama TaxID=1316150 RepID=A0ACA9KNP7_9GLOM|nr:6173_t:CDS:2 [Dentiscutata heterogama]
MNTKKYRNNILDNKNFTSEDIISSDDIASSDSITGSNKRTNSDILSSDNENPGPKFAWLAKTAKFNNNFVIDCKYLKKQSIKRHIQTKDHQRLIKTREESQIGLKKAFTQQLGASHLSVIQNLIIIYWLAKNLIATYKITDLTSLTKYHIKSNLEEVYTFEDSYALNYPLLESLEECCADYGSYSNTYAA